MRKVKTAMFQNLESVTVVLRALSNSSRLRIALALLNTELSVATLEESLEIKQPNLSQQLAEVLKAGILEARRSAKSVFYSIADSWVRDVIALVAANIDGVTLPQVAIETATEPLRTDLGGKQKLPTLPDAATGKSSARTISILNTSPSNASDARTWQGEEARFAKVWVSTNH